MFYDVLMRGRALLQTHRWFILHHDCGMDAEAWSHHLRRAYVWLLLVIRRRLSTLSVVLTTRHWYSQPIKTSRLEDWERYPRRDHACQGLTAKVREMTTLRWTLTLCGGGRGDWEAENKAGSQTEWGLDKGNFEKWNFHCMIISVLFNNTSN